MSLLWCSAIQMTPHSSDMDSPVPRRPLPTKTVIFGNKSWNSPEHKLSATHSTETLKWHFYDVLSFQWHHTRRISTRLFREDLPRRKQQFWSKSWNTHSHKGNATHWTETPLNATSKMFCASNDTTLVWYGLACSEKTSPDENGIFSGQHHETHQNTN